METRASHVLTNGRDLGGLPTGDGRRVRPGLLFRSDDTGWGQGTRSTELPDRAATVFDLRRPEEVEARGLPWFVDDRTAVHSPNLAPVGTVATTIGDARELAAFYLRILEAQRENLGGIAGELAGGAELPAVVYCVAGKDRTGVTVATLGRLLGVTDQGILEDYVRSAVFMEGVRASGQLGDLGRSPVVLPLYDAPQEAMAIFLDGLTARYTTVASLTESLGLEADVVQRLRERYLTAETPSRAGR